MRKHLIVAVTGATGAIYVIQTLRALLRHGHQADVVISKYGLLTLKEETDFGNFKGSFIDYFYHKYSDEVAGGELVAYNYKDLAAPIASGSGITDGMVIVPCTVKTLAAVASGYSNNLIERAADVVLKESRPLVLVVRETPLNLVHLRNMMAAAEAGARILPASPAFYQHPQTFEDLGDFIAARILNLFDIRLPLYPKWEGTTKSQNKGEFTSMRG
jgi:4-hydroxy-3-polyprenylbenzoate decarboxylase